MVQIELTNQAVNDLENIVKYISKDSEQQAQLQSERLIKRSYILKQFPKIGRIVPELKSKKIRELIEGNYRIIYWIVNKDLIHILTFHHSKRKLKRSVLKRMIR